jgi:uncharacterized protein YjiK
MKLFYTVLLFLILTGQINCKNNSSVNGGQDKKKHKTEESVFPVKIPEPSGLAFSMNKDALYTVSDKTGNIYKIDFRSEILEKLKFNGHDLEGIDVDRHTGDIWVAEEEKELVLHLDRNGELIEKLDNISVKTKGNTGFEGLAICRDTLYILVEKDPGVLIVYSLLTKEWKKHHLDFADDYSGIDYDETDNTLWIVSHESRTLNHCTTRGKLIDKQKLDIRQAEGVVVDRKQGFAWIIDDPAQRLYKVKLKI